MDCGIALDGDGDRAIFVDEKGNVLDGDMILALCGTYLKEKGLLLSNTVVATVMSNFGLNKFLDRSNIKLERTQVGDRYVYEAMQKIGSNLGGEQSGHNIFNDHSTTGDGTLTALIVLSIMVEMQKSLSELVEGFERYPQKLINIPVRSKPPLDTIEPVFKLIQAERERTERYWQNPGALFRY